MKKSVVLMGMLSAMLLTSAHANFLKKPSKCPTMASIKQVGIQHARQSEVGSDWVAWSNNNYNTNDLWMFIIISIEAKNESNALQKAQKMLPKFQHVGGPPIPEDDAYSCLYTTPMPQEKYAIAITPPLITSTLMKRLSMKYTPSY